jgi:putative NADPH-quinone reductase
MKGWIDRVVRPGIAYAFEEGDSGEGVPKGLLKARVALVFNTGNTPIKREKKAFGDPLELLWNNCVFRLCGVKRFRRRLYGVVVTSSAGQREEWLDDARELIREELNRGRI